MNTKIEKLLLGFASGVMIAASVWSLLIPSIEMREEQSNIPWMPATVGFLFGILFLYALDSNMFGRRLNFNTMEHSECLDNSHTVKGKLKKTAMMVFAVTLHNIPEG